MLHTYFAGVLDDRIIADQQARLSTSFRRWAETFDLVNSSYLNPTPPPYLSKVLRFNEGRLKELSQILKYMIWPDLPSLEIDPTDPAQTRYPQFYLGRRLKHFFRLIFRAGIRHVG
jgi:hypothetical protein